jgi:hypothetical protein
MDRRQPVDVVRDCALQAPPDAASDVLDHGQDMDACLAGDSMEGIYAALQRHGGSWAEATLKQLRA